MMRFVAITHVTYSALGAITEEVLVPRKANIIVRAGRGDKGVTQILERFKVRHPKAGSLRRCHVGLGGFIGPRERLRMGDKRNAEITHSFGPAATVA